MMPPCPKLLKLQSGHGKEITLWTIDTVAKYNQCRALNDAKNPQLRVSLDGNFLFK